MRNGSTVNGFSSLLSTNQAHGWMFEHIQLHYKSMCEILGQSKNSSDAKYGIKIRKLTYSLNIFWRENCYLNRSKERPKTDRAKRLNFFLSTEQKKKLKTLLKMQLFQGQKIQWEMAIFGSSINFYPCEDALVSKSSSLLTSATNAVHLSFSLSSVTGSMFPEAAFAAAFNDFFSFSLALIRPINRITSSHNLEIILQLFQSSRPSSLLHCFRSKKEKAQVC